MVFPADPVWQANYNRSHSEGRESLANVRFRSWGTEELLVRCCMKFMPWLRTIHILLSSESQMTYLSNLNNLMNQNTPRLHFVFHREFIPRQHVPTFNVCTIEMWLHKIPDLSEYFIYSNDDFFPLSPLEPEDFFRPAPAEIIQNDGGGNEIVNCKSSNCKLWWPCQRFGEKPFPAKPNIFQSFVKNGLDMVAADFGKQFPDTWLRGGHSMQPMLRSTVEHVCTKHADRIACSFTQQRSPCNFNQYIFPFWQHISGQYIDHEPKHAYVGPKVPTDKVAEYLRDPNPGIVCLNDNECMEDWQNRAAIVRREIEARL